MYMFKQLSLVALIAAMLLIPGCGCCGKKKSSGGCFPCGGRKKAAQQVDEYAALDELAWCDESDDLAWADDDVLYEEDADLFAYDEAPVSSKV